MHTVALKDTEAWDAIRSLAARGGGYVASVADPSEYGVPRSRWTQVFQLFYKDRQGRRQVKPRYDLARDPTGHETLAEDITARLSAPDRPAVLMCDELSSRTQELLARTARALGGELGIQWGAYVVNGPGVSYRALNQDPSGSRRFPHDAIDQLLGVAACRIGVETYAYYTAVPGNATSARFNYSARPDGSLRPQGERDDWLRAFIVGGRNPYGIAEERMGYLASKARGTSAVVQPIVGVTDAGAPIAYLQGPAPSSFVDRMLWVYANTAYAAHMRIDNGGGAGSWKWQAANTTDPARDTAFAEAYDWYCRDGNSAYRLGEALP